MSCEACSQVISGGGVRDRVGTGWIAAGTHKAWRGCSPLVGARQLLANTRVLPPLISRATLFLLRVSLKHDLHWGVSAVARWLL